MTLQTGEEITPPFEAPSVQNAKNYAIVASNARLYGINLLIKLQHIMEFD